MCRGSRKEKMKKLNSVVLAAALALMPGMATASSLSTSSTPTHDGKHSLSFSGSLVNADPGAWTPANTGSIIYIILVCTSAVSAQNTPSTDRSPLVAAGCTSEVRAKGTFNPVTDLENAEVAGVADYDPDLHGRYILLKSISTVAIPNIGDPEPPVVWTATVEYGVSSPDTSGTTTRPSFSAPAPFQGPVITAPSIPSSNAPGSTITIPGENLDGVSAVSIGSTDAEVEVIDDQLQVVVPESLEAGTYDLVISSSTGNVTISDAITVSGVAVSASEAPRGSTTRDDDEVKVRVFNPSGAGKVQIIVNGEEIAWVRTDDPNDSKLTNGYLVRTVELVRGKNVIEIFVDGERIRRNAYTL